MRRKKKSKFIWMKDKSESILFDIDLRFDYLVDILSLVVDLEIGTMDQSYWRDGKLNNNIPLRIGRNVFKFNIGTRRTCHNFKVTFAQRSYGTLYVKKFDIGALYFIPKVPSKHTTDLQNMLDQPKSHKLSDVIFNIDGHKIHASRYILAARSEYFAKLLCGKMKESVSKTVYIKKATYKSFYTVILYLYTGYIPELDWKDVIEVLKLAHEYLIGDLEEEMQKCLLININQFNANEILLISQELQFQSLKNYAMEYVLNNVKSFGELTRCPELLLEVAETLALKQEKDNQDLSLY